MFSLLDLNPNTSTKAKRDKEIHGKVSVRISVGEQSSKQRHKVNDKRINKITYYGQLY